MCMQSKKGRRSSQAYTVNCLVTLKIFLTAYSTSVETDFEKSSAQ